MHANGQTTVWGSHLGIGRGRDAKRWSQQLRDRWTAYRAARQQTKRESLHRCWNADREVVTPLRADAAPEMAAAQHALSVATMLYGLSE